MSPAPRWQDLASVPESSGKARAQEPVPEATGLERESGPQPGPALKRGLAQAPGSAQAPEQAPAQRLALEQALPTDWAPVRAPWPKVADPARDSLPPWCHPTRHHRTRRAREPALLRLNGGDASMSPGRRVAPNGFSGSSHRSIATDDAHCPRGKLPRPGRQDLVSQVWPSLVCLRIFSPQALAAVSDQAPAEHVECIGGFAAQAQFLHPIGGMAATRRDRIDRSSAVIVARRLPWLPSSRPSTGSRVPAANLLSSPP